MQTMAGAAAPTQPKPTSPFSYLALAVLLVGTIVLLWGASSSYEIYKTLHVVFAVIWVGGGGTFTVMALLADRRRSDADMPVIVRYADWFGARVFTPSSLVILAFGIAMVEKADWGWGVFWIDFALAVWALSFVVGAGFLAPLAHRIHKAFAESGGELTPEVAKLVDRIILIARFDVVMLMLIVVDMTAKPTF